MTTVTVNKTETTVTRQENTTVVKVGSTENLVVTQAKQGLPGSGGGGDHGALTGLDDDDHPQYHNNARGDARYSQLGHTHSSANITDFASTVQSIIAGETPVVHYYDQSTTWDKPAGLKFIWAVCIGPGGPSGSGRRGAADSNRCGGQGGQPGYVTDRIFLASQLGSTETITIGTQSTGGAAVTADNTNGNPGIVGGITVFGGTTILNGKLHALPGSPGAGGTSNGTIPIAIAFSATTQYYPGMQTGNGATQGNNGTWSAWGPGGGASGGGLNTSNVEANGGDGTPRERAFFSASIGGGHSGGTPGGTINGTAGDDGITDGTSPYIFGAGASAGASKAAAPAGNGADGGNPGGGASGGGASANGFASGEGGKGGKGAIYIFEFY